MSDLLPLFPLPNVVLFPNVFLPLHIFEPRYREMVADALASDRMIGMVLLQPGWERDYDGRPPVYPIGCSGVITHVERLRRRPLQHRAARPRAVPDRRGGSRAGAIAAPWSSRCCETRAGGPRIATCCGRSASKLEALLAPAVERPGADPRTAVGA